MFDGEEAYNDATRLYEKSITLAKHILESEETIIKIFEEQMGAFRTMLADLKRNRDLLNEEKEKLEQILEG